MFISRIHISFYYSCGKLFKTNLEVEFHATKSGHDSFSESTEEKRPLTEEEKKEQLRLLEEKMRQKRKEREELEKKEALEKERLRIRSGKEMVEAKKKLALAVNVGIRSVNSDQRTRIPPKFMKFDSVKLT